MSLERLQKFSIEETAMDDYVNQIAKLVEQDKEDVREILELLSKMFLHNIYKESLEKDKGVGDREEFSMLFPILGQIIFDFNSYNVGDEVRHSLSTDINLEDDFKEKVKQAYFQDKDFLKEEVSEMLSDELIDDMGDYLKLLQS